MAMADEEPSSSVGTIHSSESEGTHGLLRELGSIRTRRGFREKEPALRGSDLGRSSEVSKKCTLHDSGLQAVAPPPYLPATVFTSPPAPPRARASAPHRELPIRSWPSRPRAAEMSPAGTGTSTSRNLPVWRSKRRTAAPLTSRTGRRPSPVG